MLPFHLIRSLLFTPATHPERFVHAVTANTDALIIDLEDAIAPQNKALARENALQALAQPFPLPRIVRINALDTTTGLADVLALTQQEQAPDYLLIPKTESAYPLQLLDKWLSHQPAIQFIGLIESARAIQNLSQISTASPRLAGFMLGTADLTASLGCHEQAPNLLQARIELITACAAAGIAAIDSPCFDLDNESALKQEVNQAVTLGFTGKAAIHPKQITSIHKGFYPNIQAIQTAKMILDEAGKGAVRLNGKMIDEAMIKQAQHILKMANLIAKPSLKP